MKQVIYLVFCSLLLGFQLAEGGLGVNLKDLSVLPSLGELTAKEGTSVVIECNVNVSEPYDGIAWYNSKGHLLNVEEPGGKWITLNNSSLNITSVSFEDRGRYTCIVWSSAGVSNYTLTLRVSYTHSGLGLYYVVVCTVAFFITIILNLTRLCMVNTHLRKTERAINDFFHTEGHEKLQKAVEIAKRIPIVTSARTLELAKVTQFKTLELAKQMEELARSVPLPPLILHCRTFVDEEAMETPGCGTTAGDQEEEREALNRLETNTNVE